MTQRALAEEISRMHMEYIGDFNRVMDLFINRGEQGILLWLYSNDKEVYATDLMEYFDLTAGRVANILKKLEGDGFITRQRQREDLRKSKIFLTEAGREQAMVYWKGMVDQHEQLISKIGQDNALQMMQNLVQMMKALKD